MKSFSPEDIVRRVWPQESNSDFYAPEHQILWHALGGAFNERYLPSVQKFFDPALVDNFLGDNENGFSARRRLRLGEARKVVHQRRQWMATYGLGADGKPDPAIAPKDYLTYEKQRARGTAELLLPLPEESDNPHAAWPVGTRFCVALDMRMHEGCAPFLNPKETTVYYDAVTMERFVVPVLDEIAKVLPDMKAQCDQIKADLRWWVEHDAKHVPGVDDR
jgi:hypothetical protein